MKIKNFITTILVFALIFSMLNIGTQMVNATESSVSLVVNGGFEADGWTYYPTDWTEEGDLTSSFVVPQEFGGLPRTGDNALYHTANGITDFDITTKQEITNLQNGTYQLSAWVIGGGNATHKLSATGYGGADIHLDFAPKTSYTQILIEDIQVSNGTCTISIHTNCVNDNGNWMYIDDVEFVPISLNENSAPVANNGDLTVISDVANNGTLIASDPNGDMLTYSIVNPPTKGTVSIIDLNTGTYSYTPNAGIIGEDSFTFKVNDGEFDSNIATVNVSIEESQEADLTSLSVNVGELQPVFSADTMSYSMEVDYGINEIIISACMYSPTSNLSINNTPVAVTNGVDGELTVPLIVGINNIPVKVTAGDGSISKTYTIAVTRDYSSSENIDYYPSYGDLSQVPELSYSEDYSVKVNGKEIEILRSNNDLGTPSGSEDPLNWRSVADAAHFGMFAFEDSEVTIEITCNFPIESYKLKPTAYGIESTQKGNVITFTISDPNMYICLEANGYTNPLFIFAEEPETNIPSKEDPNVIWFDPGFHYIGKQYQITEGQTVYLSPGSVVLGNFWANDQDNIKFLGRGIVTGSCFKHDGIEDGEETAIGAWRSNNVEINGPTFVGHTYITLGLNGKDIVIKNVKCIAWDYNTDVFHLNGNGQYANLFAMSNDDKLRSTHGADGGSITNAVVWHMKGGNLFIDAERTEPIRDLEYKDIYVIRSEVPLTSQWGGGINTYLTDAPAYMTNIRFYNVYFEDCNGPAIDMDLGRTYPWYDISPPYERGNTRDILFSNFNVPDNMTCVIKGLDNNHTISNVKFNNYKVNGVVATDMTSANGTTNDYAEIEFNTGMIVLTSPYYNDLIDVDTSVTITAEAYDFSEDITKMEFYVDDVKIGEDDTKPYSIEWIATSGMHQLQAKGIHNGKAYQSSEMTIGVGKNILKNPGFENEDMSMWVPMDEGVTISRVDSWGSKVTPRSGSYMAKVSGNRPSYNTFKQDVKDELLLYGQGIYGIQASMTYNDRWIGYEAVLKIVDDSGEKYYKSKGLEHWWYPTVNLRFQDVEWTGELISAEFYLYTSSEDNRAHFPVGSTTDAVVFDDCKLSFISTDYINPPLSELNFGFEKDNGWTQEPSVWREYGDIEASFVNDQEQRTGVGALEHCITSGGEYSVNTQQTISGLDNGFYKLSAWVKGGGPGEHKISVVGYGSYDMDIVPSLTATYSQIETNIFEVKNGTCTIIISTNANSDNGDWMLVDDIELIPVIVEPPLITNGDFEDAGGQEPIGWSETGDVEVSFLENSSTYDPATGTGGWYLVHCLNSGKQYTVTTQQTVSNLENGTYNLSAWVWGGGPGEHKMTVTGHGGDEMSVVPSLTGSFSKIEISDITITSRECTVSFYSKGEAGDWIVIDNVQLTLVNATPIASDGVLTVNASTTKTGALIASDSDEDTLTFNVLDHPTKGAVTLIDENTGEFSYTSNGVTGEDSFTFYVNDGECESSIATVYITIASDDDDDDDDDDDEDEDDDDDEDEDGDDEEDED